MPKRTIFASLICALLPAGAPTANAALLDRGGGLIYDTVLDITWLQDANTGGNRTWAAASSWAENFSYYDSVRGVTWDDWRLPGALPVNGSEYMGELTYNGTTDHGYNITSTQSELAHLYHVSLGNLSYCEPSSGSTCIEQEGWELYNTGPFLNFDRNLYWTSASTFVDGWAIALRTAFTPPNPEVGLPLRGPGYQQLVQTGFILRSWAVRDGDVAVSPIPEPETYAMLLAGLALLGFQARRRTTKLQVQATS